MDLAGFKSTATQGNKAPGLSVDRPLCGKPAVHSSRGENSPRLFEMGQIETLGGYVGSVRARPADFRPFRRLVQNFMAT